MFYDLFNIKKQLFIITGGAGLIGQRYVHALVDAGASVVIADSDEKSAYWLAESIESDQAYPHKVDVSDPASVQSLVDKTLKKFGRIDGLVNNAALDPKMDPAGGANHTLSFENYPLHLWRQTLDVNTTGMFLCTQAVAPFMLKRGKGVVVNISSIYGLVGPDQRLYEKDVPQSTAFYKPVAYSVTKAAVLGFTTYLAAYWRDKGIRVNTLTLGGVFNGHDDNFVRRYNWRAPLNRMANPDEYCAALIFLLSDASSYMTGANLVVDGGWTAW